VEMMNGIQILLLSSSNSLIKVKATNHYPLRIKIVTVVIRTLLEIMIRSLVGVFNEISFLMKMLF